MVRRDTCACIDMTAGMTANSMSTTLFQHPTSAARRTPLSATGPSPWVKPCPFPVTVNTDQGDTVSLPGQQSCAGRLDVNDSAQYSFTPVAAEEGVHVFRFTTTGRDGPSEQTISVTVTSDSTPSDYQQWAAGQWGVDTGSLPPEAAAEADADGDNASNLAEFYLGTNPRDSNSRLTVQIVGRSATDATLLISPVVEPGTYYLQETTSLTGPWSDPQPMQVEGAGESGEVQHPVNGIQTFFRIIYQPPAE